MLLALIDRSDASRIYARRLKILLVSPSLFMSKEVFNFVTSRGRKFWKKEKALARKLPRMLLLGRAQLYRTWRQLVWRMLVP
jgi:hypothetical protein